MHGSVNGQGVLAGQVALITGASRGIGEALARRFAMEGARVLVTARTLDSGDHILPGGLRQTVAAIRAAGGVAEAIQADLARSEDRDRLVRVAEEQFGPIDILVNNAAVIYFGQLDELSDKRYRLMMEIQVHAAVHLSRLVLPGMKQRGRGWILNMSSRGAAHPALTDAAKRDWAYGMCKAALERMTTGLAAAARPYGIGVNALAPGAVATPGRMHGKPITAAESRAREIPMEAVTEACLRLCHGDPGRISGMLTDTPRVLREFQLQASPLIPGPELL